MLNVLLSALAAAGVAVSTHDGACPNIQGLYNTDTRAIKVCREQGTWTPIAQEILRHEAIHAVQHCRNGLSNMTASNKISYYYRRSQAMGFDLNQSLAPYIRAGFPMHVIHMEAEAWTLQRALTNQQTAELVNDVCGPLARGVIR